jgi:hypothetical protein
MQPLGSPGMIAPRAGTITLWTGTIALWSFALSIHVQDGDR